MRQRKATFEMLGKEKRLIDIFYESDTCERFHNPDTGLYLYGDLYIVDEVMHELQDKQG